jgi:hypothetical protein
MPRLGPLFRPTASPPGAGERPVTVGKPTYQPYFSLYRAMTRREQMQVIHPNKKDRRIDRTARSKIGDGGNINTVKRPED